MCCRLAGVVALMAAGPRNADAAGSSGCVAWAEDPLARVLPTSLPPAKPGAALSPFPLAAARSQVVSLQVCVHNPSVEIGGAQLDVVGLPATFNWTVRLVSWVNTTTADELPGGMFPDPLLPGPAAGATLSSGRTTVFWLDVAIPEALAESGRTYPVTVRVVKSVDSTVVATITNELRVFNFSVRTRSLHTDSSVNGLDAKHWPAEGAPYFPGRSRDEVATAWYESLTSARVDAMALAPIEPSLELGSDGRLNMTTARDWKDRVMWLTKERGVRELAFPMPAGVRFSLTGGAKNGQQAFGAKIEWTHCILPNSTWEVDGISIPVFDETKSRWHSPAVASLNPVFVKRYTDMLKAIAKYVDEEGLSDVANSMEIKDEPYYVDSFTMQALLALVKLSKDAVPSLRIRQTRWPTQQYGKLNDTAISLLKDLVSTWVAHVKQYTDPSENVPKEMAAERRRGKQTTVYDNSVPVINLPSQRTALYPWMLWRTNSGNWSGLESGEGLEGSLSWYCDNCYGGRNVYAEPASPKEHLWPGNMFLLYPPLIQRRLRLWPNHSGGNRQFHGVATVTSANTPSSTLELPVELVPSIRWLLFRNGLAEAESFFVLQREIKKAKAALSYRSVHMTHSETLAAPATPVEQSEQDGTLWKTLGKAEAALRAVASCVWGLPIDSTDATTGKRLWNQEFTTNITLIRETFYRVGQAIEELRATHAGGGDSQSQSHSHSHSATHAGDGGTTVQNGSCAQVNTCASTTCPRTSGNLSAGVLIPLGPHSQRPGKGLQEWQQSVARASQLFLSLGNASKIGDPFVEVGDTLHTTLLYLCCLTPTELQAALTVLENREWPILSGLKFDRAVCVQGSQTNIVVKYSAESEAYLQAYAASVEQELRSHQIPIVVPRKDQIYFHSTLVQVPDERKAQYPFERAVQEVNAKIKPGSWVGDQGMEVQMVCCNWPNRSEGGKACPSWHRGQGHCLYLPQENP